MRVFHRAALLGVLLVTVLPSRSVATTGYRATILPSSSNSAFAFFGGTSTQQVGAWSATETGLASHAALWNGLGAALIDLHPAGYAASQATSTDGMSQAGFGSLDQAHSVRHAVLWHGSRTTAVNLNPAGYSESQATGIAGPWQVGFGSGPTTASADHALLWHGSADSVIDLHPPGFIWSKAHAVDGEFQVGEGVSSTLNQFSAGLHALLWNQTAESVISLDPPGFYGASALDIDEDRQVGWGLYAKITQNMSGDPNAVFQQHAIFWRGAAESAVDLHPSYLENSAAKAVSGRFAVGWGSGPTTGNVTHALLWDTALDQVTDLHDAASEVEPRIVRTSAEAVTKEGVVYGIGLDSHTIYAIAWTPVPEPDLSISFSFVTAAMSRRVRASYRRSGRDRRPDACFDRVAPAA
jgi:hypothetical protein